MILNIMGKNYITPFFIMQVC